MQNEAWYCFIKISHMFLSNLSIYIYIYVIGKNDTITDLGLVYVPFAQINTWLPICILCFQSPIPPGTRHTVSTANPPGS